MMNLFCRFASLLAVAGLAAPAAAQPRVAAYESSGDRSSADAFLFSGATVRLSLDGRGERRPEMAMRLAGGTRTAGMAPKIGDGIAFSAVPGAKPRVTLAGQDSKALQKRLNMSDGAKAALIVGGLVVVGLAVAMAAAADKWDDEPLAW